MLYNISNVTSEHWYYAGTNDGGAKGASAGTDGSGGAKVEGVRVEGEGSEGANEDGPSDPQALALRVLGKVTEGSSRFQKFFFI